MDCDRMVAQIREDARAVNEVQDTQEFEALDEGQCTQIYEP